MVSVTKTGAGTQILNTLVIRPVKIILQRYPGLAGSNLERAIANQPYSLFYDGVEQKTATPQSDGNGQIIVPMPAGVKVELAVFGSRYELQLVHTIEDLQKVPGVKRRLAMLGYPVFSLDDDIDYKTDAETLRFQADNNLDTSGEIDDNLRNKLKSAFGE